MVILMGILFLLGYILISLEHTIRINKAAIALVMSMVLWTLYIFIAPMIVPHLDADWFRCFIHDEGLQNMPEAQQIGRAHV